METPVKREAKLKTITMSGRIVYLLTCVIFLLSLSCEREDIQLSTPNLVEIDIECLHSGSLSKTYFANEQQKALWKSNDIVGLCVSYPNAGTKSCTDAYYMPCIASKSSFSESQYSDIAHFQGKITNKGEQDYEFYSFYPFHPFIGTGNDSNLVLQLENMQFANNGTWDDDYDYLVSKPVAKHLTTLSNISLSLSFTRLFGFLNLKPSSSLVDLYGEELIETIQIAVDGDIPLTGSFSIDMTSDNLPSPVFINENSKNEVLLNYCGQYVPLKELDAFFVVNSGRYSNITITINTNSHSIVLKRQNLSITRGDISRATLSFQTDKGDVVLERNPILPQNPSTLKVLTFGHSYVQDSMEYIDDLLRDAKETRVTFANFHMGNCSLNTYWAKASSINNTRGGSETIEYYKTVGGGERIRSNITIVDALESEDWDIIVFQHTTSGEGQYNLLDPYLENLIEYVKEVCVAKHGKTPLIAWHMFWPFATNYSLADFEIYNYNQDIQYAANVEVARKLLRLGRVQIVIPTGTTIQSLRKSKLNNSMDFTRDYFHMDYGAGRYAAACTWFETIVKPCFGKTIVGAAFIPTSYSCLPVSNENKIYLQKAAYNATKTQFETTPIIIPPLSDYNNNSGTDSMIIDNQTEW